MSARRPHSERGLWKEIGTIMFIGGALTVMVAALVEYRPGELSGSLLLISGGVVRFLAAVVWLK